jgi:hypothetical protein
MAKKKYTISKWNNLDNFECTACPFATLVEADMLKHIEAVHEPPIETVLPREEPPKLDRFGNIVPSVVKEV